MKKYNHLSIVEREKIFAWVESGLNLVEISLKLGRSHTTILRELKRNRTWERGYIPHYAQKKAERIAKRQRYKAPLKGPETLLYVREHLRMGWSPETISGRIEIDKPGLCITPETIYRYIYSTKTRVDKFSNYLVFRHKRRRHWLGRRVRRATKIPNAISIGTRPRYIDKRVQLGHWESDNMESSRSSTGAISVSVERTTRYTILTKLPNKRSSPKTASLIERFCDFPSELTRTLTLDNGSENYYHKDISTLIGFKVFFCRPYHSWEKGTVENTVGRVRRYIPKGTDLKGVSNRYVLDLEYTLNNTPRKCLGFYTPYEKMCQELRKQVRYSATTILCTSR